MTSLKTSIKTITYLSDIGCLEIQGASLPYRQMSETPLPENHLLDARLRKEKEDAINQINHVRNVLQQIKQEANHLLNH